MRGTWQTDDSARVWPVVAFVAAAVVCGPAVVWVLNVVVWVLAFAVAAAVAAVIAGAVFVVVRYRRAGPLRWVQAVPQVPAAGSPREVPAAPRRAVEGGQHLHLHFHGGVPADVAALIEGQRRGVGN